MPLNRAEHSLNRSCANECFDYSQHLLWEFVESGVVLEEGESR
jgi:hypothetical protein